MFYNLFFKNISKQKSIFNYKKKNTISMEHYNNFTKINFLLSSQELHFFFLYLLKHSLEKKKTHFISLFFNQLTLSSIKFNIKKLNIYLISHLLNNIFFINYNKKNNLLLITPIEFTSLNLSFIFFKWVLVELNKKNKLTIVNLPNKSKKYTLLRSPFVFKKGREQFEQRQIKLIVNYSFFFTASYFHFFNKKMKNSFFVKHKYYNYLN